MVKREGENENIKRAREDGGPVKLEIGNNWMFKWRRCTLKALYWLVATRAMSWSSQVLKDFCEFRGLIGVTTKPGESGKEELRQKKKTERELQKKLAEDYAIKMKEAKRIADEVKERLAKAKAEAKASKFRIRFTGSGAGSSTDEPM